MDVYARITEIQRDAFDRQGLCSNDVQEYLRERTKNQFSYEEGYDHPAVEAVLKESPIPLDQLQQKIFEQYYDERLPLQCPLAKLELESLWTSLISTFKDGEDYINGGKKAPVLSSAFTGELNAFTINGKDGSKGIVFEDGLFDFFKSATPYLANAVTSITDDKLGFELHEETQPRLLERQKKAMNVVYDLALEYVVNGRSNLRGKSAYNPATYRIELDLSMKMYSGAASFILGHEFAHIGSKHYELMRGETDRHMPTRVTEEQEVAWELYNTQYREAFPNVDRNRLITFLHWQMMEMEADSVADMLTIRKLISTYDEQGGLGAEDYSFMIGSRFPLVFFHILESILSFCVNGVDSLNSALWAEHVHVQDLVLRESHPSPLSRMRYATETQFFTFESYGYTEEHKNIINDYALAATTLLGIVEDTFENWLYDRGLNSETIKVHPKWMSLAKQLPTDNSC